MSKAIIRLLLTLIGCLLLLPFLLLSFIARFCRKPIDVGFGPEPLINNVYHKKAVMSQGYSAETFVTHMYFITNEFDKDFRFKKIVGGRLLGVLYAFVFSLFRYKAISFYFNGGSLFSVPVLREVEPFLYKIARIKTIIMPYGGDIQYMQVSPNLYFKHCFAMDYPAHLKQSTKVLKNIHRWTRWGDWIIGGCDWVDYMYFWNTLMLAHFSIDTTRWAPVSGACDNATFKILHAPNHKNLKGTLALQTAVNNLIESGYDIELVLLQGVPNSKIHEVMAGVDLVADQFVIGWYAMFALEAMSLEKPVLCYIRDDLVGLFRKAGLLEKDELPLISCDVLEIEDKLVWALNHREELREMGKNGRRFVEKHHSIESVGRVLAGCLRELNVDPSDLSSRIA